MNIITFFKKKHYEKTLRLLNAIYEDMIDERFITKMYKRIVKDIEWYRHDGDKYDNFFEKSICRFIEARYDIELDRGMITEEELPPYVHLVEEDK